MRQQKDSKTLHSPEFLARAQQALYSNQKELINSEEDEPQLLVEAIARDRDLIEGCQLIADDFSAVTQQRLRARKSSFAFQRPPFRRERS